MTDYQSMKFAQEATQAKLAELTLRLKVLEHANECLRLSERHALHRLTELQGAARSLTQLDGLGPIPLPLIDSIVALNKLLPHEDAS